jgi:hypothetical protein
MKFINIESMKKYFVMMLTVIVMSCANEDLKPIITFDDAIKGAYPKLTDETGEFLLNLLTPADFDASQYGWSVKFVDEANGANVAQYVINVEYVAASGASQGPVELKSYSTADFTTVDGNVGMEGILITSGDLTAKFGLSYATLTAGDKFLITGELIMNDGSIHNAANSSASVAVGEAFQAIFDFTMPVACPSSLEGTFDVTTDTWCGNTITTTVDIVALGSGFYTFSDWSFGAYPDCYGGYCCAEGDFTFADVCTVVTLVSGGTDSFGDSWSFTSRLLGTGGPGGTPDQWEITWLNFTYASGLENGVSTISFPGGVPFTLAP